jgi:hypothetical protein
MKTLYDLLGARPDDDAERLKNAFRNAVKAHHPDLHAGEPDAPTRFRQIVGAYAVLRHAEQRAAYDRRLLQFERKRLRSKSKRIISYMTRNTVSDAIAVAGLAVVLAGGYTLFAHIATTAEPIKVVEITARGPGKIAAVQPAARTDTTDGDAAHDELERVEVPNIAIVPSATASGANRGDAPGIANRGPALSSAGRDTEVAKIINAFGSLIDQADAKTTADHVKKNEGIEPLDQNEARSVGVQFSSPEKDNGVAKSSSSDAISDEKHHMKKPGRPRVAKRQATNHTPFKQASLENRNTSTCSGSCSGYVPPLFGVGF